MMPLRSLTKTPLPLQLIHRIKDLITKVFLKTGAFYHSSLPFTGIDNPVMSEIGKVVQISSLAHIISAQFMNTTPISKLDKKCKFRSLFVKKTNDRFAYSLIPRFWQNCR